MPVNFTLHYDDLSNDVDDVSGDIGAVVVSGQIRLTPVFDEGARIPAAFYSPRPAGFHLRVFTGYLDTDGRLKNTPGGAAGMRVWANDPEFGLDRLQYHVQANLVDPRGRRIAFKPFYFDAPTVDSVVYLALEMPQPDQDFKRGRPGFGLVDLDVTGLGELVFIVADGTELGPVPLVIPELADALGSAAAGSAAYALTFGA